MYNCLLVHVDRSRTLLLCGFCLGFRNLSVGCPSVKVGRLFLDCLPSAAGSATSSAGASTCASSAGSSFTTKSSSSSSSFGNTSAAVGWASGATDSKVGSPTPQPRVASPLAPPVAQPFSHGRRHRRAPRRRCRSWRADATQGLSPRLWWCPASVSRPSRRGRLCCPLFRYGRGLWLRGGIGKGGLATLSLALLPALADGHSRGQ